MFSKPIFGGKFEFIFHNSKIKYTNQKKRKKSPALWNVISYRLHQGRVIGSVALHSLSKIIFFNRFKRKLHSNGAKNFKVNLKKKNCNTNTLCETLPKT